jgi:LPXTG-motif cell wall-anchored protein
MLALTRKLIILDFATINSEKLFALGFVILVLGVVYYLFKKKRVKNNYITEYFINSHKL